METIIIKTMREEGTIFAADQEANDMWCNQEQTKEPGLPGIFYQSIFLMNWNWILVVTDTCPTWP